MRDIAKANEPKTVTDTRHAATTDLTTKERARDAFNQLDKAQVRAALVHEQGYLCAFCMLRVRTEDDKGSAAMRIAHRTPIEVDSTQALNWRNLLGSCEGRERSKRPEKTCDVAQRSRTLTIDPTVAGSCSRLRYERATDRRGLIITSDDASVKQDVEETLALNTGDLPELREKAWNAFCDEAGKHAGGRAIGGRRSTYRRLDADCVVEPPRARPCHHRPAAMR